MRRRKLIAAAVGLAAVVVAGAFVPSPPRRVTRENFDRIECGLSVAEVGAILGPPNLGPADVNKLNFAEFCDPSVSDWREKGALGPNGLLASKHRGDWQGWLSAEGLISVNFVEGETAHKAWLRRVGVVERMKLQWRRWFPG
jgi:hypothetical protein